MEQINPNTPVDVAARVAPHVPALRRAGLVPALNDDVTEENLHPGHGPFLFQADIGRLLFLVDAGTDTLYLILKNERYKSSGDSTNIAAIVKSLLKHLKKKIRFIELEGVDKTELYTLSNSAQVARIEKGALIYRQNPIQEENEYIMNKYTLVQAYTQYDTCGTRVPVTLRFSDEPEHINVTFYPPLVIGPPAFKDAGTDLMLDLSFLETPMTPARFNKFKMFVSNKEKQIYRIKQDETPLCVIWKLAIPKSLEGFDRRAHTYYSEELMCWVNYANKCSELMR